MKISIAHLRRRFITFIVMFVLFFFGPIAYSMYTRPEAMLKFVPGVLCALWVLVIIFGDIFYQLRKKELEVSQIDYPMTMREAWCFFGGYKSFFVTILLALLPIGVQIIYEIST